jgi:hypothetical protein
VPLLSTFLFVTPLVEGVAVSTGCNRQIMREISYLHENSRDIYAFFDSTAEITTM